MADHKKAVDDKRAVAPEEHSMQKPGVSVQKPEITRSGVSVQKPKITKPGVADAIKKAGDGDTSKEGYNIADLLKRDGDVPRSR